MWVVLAENVGRFEKCILKVWVVGVSLRFMVKVLYLKQSDVTAWRVMGRGVVALLVCANKCFRCVKSPRFLLLRWNVGRAR